MSAEGPESGRERPAEPPAQAEGLFADIVMALRFFSRLPTGESPHQAPDTARIAMGLPFASLAIGFGPAVLLVLGAGLGLPTLFAAALAVGGAALAGGAMAEDALADSADGLFGGATPARRLEIMRDSRHGTYGVVALCLFLVLRVAALAAIAEASPLAAGAVWLAVGVIARSAGLWLLVRLPSARAEGAGAAAGRLPGRHFAVGALFATILALILAGPFAGYLALGVALMASGLVALGWEALCRGLVGGQTGDLSGAAIGLCEVAALAAFLVFIA